MDNEGSPFPPLKPQSPQPTVIVPPAQEDNAVPPVESPVQHVLPPVQCEPVPALNWLHLKTGFVGKLDKDAGACLLRKMIVWTHAFPEGVKVQRFYFTLGGDTGLWYESLTPIAVGCSSLKSQVRCQYSRIGNTREQLLHTWSSFHIDRNSVNIDSYVTCIRQVAAQ